MQRPPPQTHLHVPGAPAVLPVHVGGGRVELRVPLVSEEVERGDRGNQSSLLFRVIFYTPLNFTEVSLTTSHQFHG